MREVIHANLDCEARWSGVVLPAAVQRRISAAAVLLAALPDAGLEEVAGDVAMGEMPVRDVWAPAAVDPARLRTIAGWTPPRMHVGAPPAAERGGDVIAWADASARGKAANDRRIAHAVARAEGCALPGATVVTSVEELERHLASGGAGAGVDGRWVCKAVWTAAGRDRWHGRGDTIGAEGKTRIARLIERGATGAYAGAGAVVFEPWVERVRDLGVCGRVRGDGEIVTAAPHVLRCDARGGFAGIVLGGAAADEAGEIDDNMRDTLAHATRAAGSAIAEVGYVGPFAVDAFVYRSGGGGGGGLRLQPICEINARYSFGWVARGIARRTGAREIGFDAAPEGASVIVDATEGDAFAAWVR